MENIEIEPQSQNAIPSTFDMVDEIVGLLRADPQALAEVSSRLAPDDSRCDGWTGFARRLFLEVLAETGRVSTACEYARLTRQSAYALRARDPLFAASWDAACELARQPLADALYEKALDGVTDTIIKDGEVVATRHRFDSRLSIAVLNRLDKRLDRAEERGSRHLAVAARWDECMQLVAAGDAQALHALIDPARHCQTCQLPESEIPTATDAGEEGIDLSDRCWKDDIDETWMTDFPPPEGFSGYESGDYDEESAIYNRACTPEEVAILEADAAADRAAERAEEEALRDAWFELLSGHSQETEDEDPEIPADPLAMEGAD